MGITIVILLVLLSIFFFIVELFLLPGTTIAGIFATILSIGAIWYAYAEIGIMAGNITLLGGFLLFGIATWIFLKSKALDKMSLKTNIKGNSTSISTQIEVGNTAVTLSRLAPMGKILINGATVEAKTNGEFIDENTEVNIVEVNKTNVLVKKSEN